MASVAWQTVVLPCELIGPKGVDLPRVGLPRLLSVAIFTRVALAAVVDVEVAPCAVFGEILVGVVVMALLTVERDMATDQLIVTVAVVQILALGPPEGAVALFADALSHLPLMEISVTGLAVGLNGLEVAANMAVVAVDLLMLPDEFEPRDVVVCKIVDLPGLEGVTVAAEFVAELSTVKIDVTTIAVARDGPFCVSSRMALLTVDILMRAFQ